MEATDIISLLEAKAYLALDDTSRDDEVTRMIGAAIRSVEESTNHILVEKVKPISIRNGCARIYDYPRVSDVPSGITETNKGLYTVWSGFASDDYSADVTFGYSTLEEVPPDLVEACYLMLKFFFFEQEGNGKIPLAIEQILAPHKRFIL